MNLREELDQKVDKILEEMQHYKIGFASTISHYNKRIIFFKLPIDDETPTVEINSMTSKNGESYFVKKKRIQLTSLRNKNIQRLNDLLEEEILLES